MADYMAMIWHKGGTNRSAFNVQSMTNIIIAQKIFEAMYSERQHEAAQGGTRQHKVEAGKMGWRGL